MALVVEDGTGLANADSYISEADADVYVAAFEPEGKADWDAATSGEKEVALRKAAQWLDVTYVLLWKGSRIDEDMALDWPRKNVVSEGALLDSDAVPERVRQAQVEAAVRLLSEELLADVSVGTDAIQRERAKLGPLEEEVSYIGSKDTQVRVPKVFALLKGLLKGSARVVLA